MGDKLIIPLFLGAKTYFNSIYSKKKGTYRYGLLYVILTLLLSGCNPQQPSDANDGNKIFKQDFILTLKDVPVLVDSASAFNFEEVRESKDFQILSSFRPRDYRPSHTYWIKIPEHVVNRLSGIWILEFYDQTIDSISAYLPSQSGLYHETTVGDFFPFSKKTFAHKNFEWVINETISKEHEYYFKVKSHTYADIRLAIRTIDRFVHYSLNEYFLYGIFYGMIFIISMYNVLMFLAMKEKRYLFYTFYLVSVGFYAMCIDGIAYQYLWPKWPEWNQIAYGAALFSLILWSLVFSRLFLNTKIRAPHLDKLLSIIIVLRTLLFAYTLLFDHDLFEYRNIEILPLSLIFYVGISIWLKGYKPARFYVLAYGILFLGFLVKALLYLSIIPFSILSYYTLHVCFLLEMLFLTFALGDRVRILKANRDKAMKRSLVQYEENNKLKDKVNQELENRIRERTQQIEEKNRLLEETNAKLSQQTLEINQINSKLDLDNWKLKTNIKDILQDRLINKDLSYEEFHKIFPNEITCFQFLDKLKWSKGYRCIKCSHDKYSTGHNKFSRRCTRCGYDESITSNTIFHRLRFSIEKAFYILYLSHNPTHHYTLDQLSEILDLRRNTVWGFKKKVEQVFGKDANDKQSILIRNLFAEHVTHK